MSTDSSSPNSSWTSQTSHETYIEIEMTQIHHNKSNQITMSQQEMKIGLWFFDAYHCFQFSMSTLYLSISLLDRLRKLKFPIQETKKTLLAGTIALLASKFNEVRQLQIKKINKLQGVQYGLNEYREMQGDILRSLCFVMVDQQNIYYKLNTLHYKYRQSCTSRIQLFCKLHLQYEETRRYGNSVFIDAVNYICNATRLPKCQRTRSIKSIAKMLLQYEERTAY